MFACIKRDWDLGRFQWYVIVIYCFCSTPWLYGNQAIIFITPRVDHWCYSDAPSFLNLSLDDQHDVMGDSCTRPAVNFSTFSSEELVHMNFSDYSRISCDKGYVYKKGLFEYTATEKLELVCDRAWLSNMINTVYMFGYFISAIGSGALGDRFGRRKTMLSFAFLGVLAHAINAIVPSIATFLLFRFVGAICDMGAFLNGYIVSLEVVHVQHRKMPSIYWGIIAGITIPLLGVVVMYISHFEHLLFFISGIYLLSAIILYFVFPESPRWLHTQNRLDELKIITDRMARMNGTTFDLFEITPNKVDDGINTSIEKVNLLDIFKTPILRKRTLICCNMWCTVVLVWYALMFGLQDFGPDVRISLIISSMMELPGNFLILFTVDRLGRQVSSFIYMLLSGLCCLAMAPIVEDADSLILMVLALLGKFFAAVQFAIVYLHTPELYPTVCRTTGLGTSSTVARIAGMLAPQISLLNNYWPPFMVVVLGSCALVSAALAPMLPDTTGRELPQTLEDGENFCGDHTYKLVLPSATRPTKPVELNNGNLEKTDTITTP